uniref:Dynein heavy chain 7, axonemal n=1 Tax=Angiostrongylus cantonensis TaxID=6313 RepID=A0A0K0CY41_ANGCA
MIVKKMKDIDKKLSQESFDVIHKYVPPRAAADVEGWLCEDKPMIEEELKKQNYLLAHLHRQGILTLWTMKPRLRKVTSDCRDQRKIPLNRIVEFLVDDCMRDQNVLSYTSEFDEILTSLCYRVAAAVVFDA